MWWQQTNIQISLTNHQYQTIINSNISQLHLWKLMWPQVVGYRRCRRAVHSQINSKGLTRRTKKKERNKRIISPMMRARQMEFSGAPSADSHLTCSANSPPIIMICTVHFLFIIMKTNAYKISSIMSPNSNTHITPMEMKIFLNNSRLSIEESFNRFH